MKTFVRYVGVGGLSFVLSIGLTALLHEVFDFAEVVAFAMALAFVFCTNFVLARSYIFVDSEGGGRGRRRTFLLWRKRTSLSAYYNSRSINGHHGKLWLGG
jgi:putative flippase GtrA